jgi:hypothetical protein
LEAGRRTYLWADQELADSRLARVFRCCVFTSSLLHPKIVVLIYDGYQQFIAEWKGFDLEKVI